MTRDPTGVPGYGSWGRVPHAPPAAVHRIGWTSDAPDALARAVADGRPVLAYGRGRSYGDACLNGGGTILDTRGLDRLLAFDASTGVLRAEAGVTLAEVLAVSVPRGWFLPVTPGTQYVTLGGAVAHDVHGKNHHEAGTLGRFVTAIGLVRSTGEVLTLRPGDPLFGATVAGLGLTGLITWVEIRMIPVASDRVDTTTTRFRSLDEFFALSERAGARSPYVMAWLDALHPGGRGLLMEGDHAPADGPLPSDGDAHVPRLSVPFDAPEWALSPLSIRAFNAVYYRQLRGVQARARDPLPTVLLPPRRRRRVEPRLRAAGLLPVPVRGALRGFARRRPRGARTAGPRPAPARSSLCSRRSATCPRRGCCRSRAPGSRSRSTSPTGATRPCACSGRCDEIVREAGGAVYPAKDAVMTPESFRAFFPAWEVFAQHLDPAFSSTFWRRVAG